MDGYVCRQNNVPGSQKPLFRLDVLRQSKRPLQWWRQSQTFPDGRHQNVFFGCVNIFYKMNFFYIDVL